MTTPTVAEIRDVLYLAGTRSAGSWARSAASAMAARLTADLTIHPGPCMTCPEPLTAEGWAGLMQDAAEGRGDLSWPPTFEEATRYFLGPVTVQPAPRASAYETEAAWRAAVDAACPHEDAARCDCGPATVQPAPDALARLLHGHLGECFNLSAATCHVCESVAANSLAIPTPAPAPAIAPERLADAIHASTRLAVSPHGRNTSQCRCDALAEEVISNMKESPMPTPTEPCQFVPAHEPWSCSVHPGGIRTSLLEPVCRVAKARTATPSVSLERVEEAASEISGNFHRDDCAVNNADEPDGCNCGLARELLASLAAAGFGPVVPE